MPRTAADLYREALALSNEERDHLLRLLSQSAGGQSSQPRSEQAWVEECQARLSDIDNGTVKTIPADEVLREARERLGN